MSTRKWKPQIEPKAQRQIKKLSPTDQARVFNSIDELSKADNPLAIGDVEYLKGSKNPKIFKRRVWPYRLFFYVKSDLIIEADVQYKGLIIITGVYYQHEGY
jgi:mRNA-degrading endonuclease RelE of RelBE toxin-antitoxin system